MKDTAMSREKTSDTKLQGKGKNLPLLNYSKFQEIIGEMKRKNNRNSLSQLFLAFATFLQTTP